MHFGMQVWITFVERIWILCFLLPLSIEYSPQQRYYEPWAYGYRPQLFIRRPQSRSGGSDENSYRIYNNRHVDVESERHFKPETIFKITETLGALNTVGKYLVNITRSGGPDGTKISEEVPSALYTISKNVLGRNVTDTIAPLVREALPLRLDENDKNIHNFNEKYDKTENLREEEESVRRGCTTPEGLQGDCSDLSDCPQLLLDLGNLRQSLCFKSLFEPGVCCPQTSEAESISTTIHSIRSTTLSTTTTSTTPKPATFAAIYYNTPETTTEKPLKLTAVSSSKFEVNNKPTAVTVPEGAVFSNIVDPEECGQPENAGFRVVGGEESLPGKWPWMAAIFLHGSRRTEFWCGGSLISAKYVLTAAHCTRDSRQRPFSPHQFTVRLGDIDLKREDEPSAPVTFKVVEIRAHKQFSRVGFYNDIAVFKLDRPARKSKFVIPLCVPPVNTKSESFAGKRATVVGWGTTFYGGKESTVQRQAVLPVWRNEDCNQAYFQPITSNFVCAGYSEGGTDACQGDSGGPLMIQWETRWIQIGVVSFGNKCGEPGYPGVYTRITEYVDWIKENTKD